MKTRHRISSLPLAAMCPQAPVLGEKYGSGRAAVQSTAFHALCADPDSPATHAKLALLTTEERLAMETWSKPAGFVIEHNGESMRLDYTDATVEAEVMLHFSDDTYSIGHLDMGWVVDFSGHRWAVVRDIKRTRYTSEPDSLQLKGYGVALAQEHDCDMVSVGVWDATEGEELVANNIKRNTAEWYQLTATLEAAAAHEGQAVTGGHCSGCYGRLHCPEHLMPAALGKANPELEPFTRGDALDNESALRGLVMAKSLEDAAAMLKEQVRAYAREHGGIIDGDKEYRAHMVKGREGVTVSRVRKLAPEMADKLITRGRPYESFGWKNRR